MANSLHSRYVDRRLSVARQQLIFATEGAANPIQSEAAVDNALLQTHFAIVHYVNELLESYRLPLVNKKNIQIDNQLFDQASQVTELAELRQLFRLSNSWLFLLSRYPQYMLQQAELSPAVKSTRQETSTPTIELIHVSGASVESLLNGNPLAIEKAQWIVDECYQLIQRQRESLIEC